MIWYKKKYLPMGFIKVAVKFSTQKIIKRTGIVYSDSNSLVILKYVQTHGFKGVLAITVPAGLST